MKSPVGRQLSDISEGPVPFSFISYSVHCHQHVSARKIFLSIHFQKGMQSYRRLNGPTFKEWGLHNNVLQIQHASIFSYNFTQNIFLFDEHLAIYARNARIHACNTSGQVSCRISIPYKKNINGLTLFRKGIHLEILWIILFVTNFWENPSVRNNIKCTHAYSCGAADVNSDLQMTCHIDDEGSLQEIDYVVFHFVLATAGWR
jgi:hypothetical protein